MSNIEIVDKFVETLLQSPAMTMQAVQLRLSATDYELVLKHADPCKMHHEAKERPFPIQTGERSRNGW